jgi:predicted nucleotidyltransferase
MTLNEGDLQDMVGAILAVSRPAAILLFGSYGRGDFHDLSDVDLLKGHTIWAY